MVFLIGPIPSENRVGYYRPFQNVVQLPFTGKMKTKGDNPSGEIADFMGDFETDAV